MESAHFGDAEIEYLRSQQSRAGNQLFADDFLLWLRKNGDFSSITMRAIPEGRVVHPKVPLTVVQGPLLMAQVLETSLLNHLNYQTLISTKAARIREIGRGQVMLEFGLRRGHDRGATAGARAALLGGADYSSNVGVSAILGYPPKGTHAHSLVQLFIALGMSEIDAFRAFADVYPDDCVLLVDTINTLESGIPNAVRVFEELRQKGHAPVGVRLDSGDLAYLSIQAARLLDADVEALCKRVIVIHHGRLLFDGDLSRLVERFAPQKKIVVALADTSVDLSAYGDVIHKEGDRITLRVTKADVPRVTVRLLSDLPVVDLVVEDPPVEDVIELVFSQAAEALP